MCLYNIITKKYPNNKIIIAHVNHNIREESKEEEEFLKKYNNNNYILETTTLYETNHSEENLRNRRYQFFEKIINKYSANILLTAHHGDDLIETILMRLTRGSSLNGYIGIKEIIYKNNYKLYRPLLNWSKEDIINYNQANNIPYRLDKSNNDLFYTRNRYRHNILPVLKEENYDVHKKFLEFSKELTDAFELIESITNKEFQKIYKDNELNIENINNHPKIIIQKLIEKYLKEIYKDDIKLINKTHVNLLKEMIVKNKNEEIHLPSNIKIEKEYNKLKLKKEHQTNEYNHLFNKYIELPNNYCLKETEDDLTKSNYILRLNLSEIKLPLIVRNYKNDDLIEIKNMLGRKKIKDILKDEKIEKENRINQPVLLDQNNNIIWLPGIKKSKFDKDKNEKYDIIIKYQKLVEKKESYYE